MEGKVSDIGMEMERPVDHVRLGQMDEVIADKVNERMRRRRNYEERRVGLPVGLVGSIGADLYIAFSLPVSFAAWRC